MRFYFCMKAALIKRFNCLSVCLMVKLLHLLPVWVSLPVQFSRLPSILRWCLISVTVAMTANRHAYSFPTFPDESSRLLIFHPQIDQAPFNHDINCPLTWIPWAVREFTGCVHDQGHPINQSTARSHLQLESFWKPCLKFCSSLFFLSRRVFIPIVIFLI